MKVYVSLRGIQLEDIEVEVSENATEYEIFEAAIKEVEADLNTSARVDYWR